VGENYYRSPGRNFYETKRENAISDKGSKLNAIQTESSDYNKERKGNNGLMEMTTGVEFQLSYRE
jgi:hypothetical protein